MIDITTINQLDAQAAHFARALTKPGVYGLLGDLGSGKTTFVKHVAHHLGITSDVISPTFMYEQIYNLPKAKGSVTRLVHWDLYRLASDSDAGDLGLEVDDEHAVYLIEWIDHAPELRQAAAGLLTFRLNPDGSRTLEKGDTHA